MSTPPVTVLRRALERALAVAIAGEREQPVVAAPAGLRPFLRFTKLPSSALAAVAHALDTDDEFRERVARSVERDDVGRAAWIWLTRPHGWQDELSALLDELALDGGPDHSVASDKSARRQLEGAERAKRRAIESAQRYRADSERLRDELDGVAAERDAARARNDELTEQIDALTADRTAAVGELKRLEAVLARRTDERRELATRVDELEVLLRDLQSMPDHEPDDLDGRAPEAAALVDLRRTIDELHQRAEGFVAEIAALRREVDGDRVATQPPGPARATVRPARRPLPVPGGLTDDSDAVALHLLGRRGAVLLVDGYNLSMVAWPGLDIAEQRSRLERILSDLAARHAGLAVELVFDGAEVLPLTRPGVRRSPGITVRFTPADVEADDALLELCEHYPHDRPVIVASNDRRVRDGARRRGANVLSAEQLLAVARPG